MTLQGPNGRRRQAFGLSALYIFQEKMNIEPRQEGRASLGQRAFDLQANGPLGQRSLPFAYTSSAAAGDVRELVVDEAENECLGGFVVEPFDHLD